MTAQAVILKTEPGAKAERSEGLGSPGWTRAKRGISRATPEDSTTIAPVMSIVCLSVILFHRYHYISLFVFFVDIPVGLSSLR